MAKSTIKIADLSDVVAFCDPGSGKKNAVVKKVGSRSAVVVVGQDELYRVFVLKAWAKRCPTETLIDEIMRTHQDFRPRRFGVESSAMQGLFVDYLRRDSRINGVDLHVEPYDQPHRIDKHYRIRSTLQPLIANGRLLVQDHQVELIEEIKTHPMSPLADLVDALSSAVTLLPRRVVTERSRDEFGSLEQYLRDTGAPEWYIQQQIRQKPGSNLRGPYTRNR